MTHKTPAQKWQIKRRNLMGGIALAKGHISKFLFIPHSGRLNQDLQQAMFDLNSLYIKVKHEKNPYSG